MLHTPLYDVPTRAYCGPTAISSIANAPISKVRKMVRRVRNESGRTTRDCNGRLLPIRGMRNEEVLTVMRRLGFRVSPRPEWGATRGMTLGAFCADRGHMGPFIVNVTGHYVAVSNGMICDTHTKTPVPFAKYPKPKWRVKRFWRFC